MTAPQRYRQGVLVIVTGMHRSGTSAMAELMLSLGCRPGPADTLMAATDANKRGHFEQWPIVAFNDRLLAEAGGHWAYPPTAAAIRAVASDQLVDEARDTLASVGYSSELDRPLMLKDPRFCLTLAFWSIVLGDTPPVAFSYREPVEVSLSLQKRNGLSLAHAQYLWFTYNRSLLEAVDVDRVRGASYAELLEDPAGVSKVLAGLDARLAHDGIEFPVDPSLHHQRAVAGDHDERTASMWQQLNAAAAGRTIAAGRFDPPEPDIESALTIVQAELHRTARMLDDDRTRAKAAYNAVCAERDRARADQKQVSASVVELEQAATQREADFRALVEEIAEARASYEALQQELAAQQHVADLLRSRETELVERLNRAESLLHDYTHSKAAAIARLSWRTKRKIREFNASRGGRSAPKATSADPPAEIAEPVIFPKVTDPAVSIVIPVHGQLAMTSNCLRSIFDAAGDTTFEVIVVDDLSPDGTAEWLEQCSNIRVVTNTVNQGFLRSTNAGVAAARGDFVCLLNNDTLVGNYWLDHLRGPFEGHANVGAVGAKLVYGNGTLQEAGGIVFSDGSGWNYGRHGDSDDPRVEIVREVDYCSAACLMVRRTVWDDIGGFDERFVPAYYEDTDLAFELRRRGLRVLYQPKAHITHFEGISHGTDENSGLKAHQVTNKAKFVDKWQSALALQHAAGTEPDVAAWRTAGPHVLVIDHEVPAPDQDSGSLRMTEILDLLVEAGCRVTFVPHNRFQRGLYTSRLRDIGVEVHCDVGSGLDSYANIPTSVDLVILSRPHVAEAEEAAVRRRFPKAFVAYDMVDYHGLRLERRGAHSASDEDFDEARSLAVLEHKLAATSDVTLAITSVEAELIEARVPTARVLVLPNIHRRFATDREFDGRNGVLFVGSWRHLPNRDAVTWLTDEIAPAVFTRDPTIVFHLVGSDLPDEVAEMARPNLQVHGWVEDLGPLVDRMRLSVAPLRFGAGLKGKVGDAMARGLPVIATPVGAEGFDAAAQALTIANSTEEFVEAIVRLHGDGNEWRRLSQDGQRLVDQHFGRAAARDAIDALIAMATARAGQNAQGSA